MIKEKRKEKNYTQEQMADFLNISVRQYVRIDHQEDFPRKDVLKKLVNILEFSTEEIGIYVEEILKKI